MMKKDGGEEKTGADSCGGTLDRSAPRRFYGNDDDGMNRALASDRVLRGMPACNTPNSQL